MEKSLRNKLAALALSIASAGGGALAVSAGSNPSVSAEILIAMEIGGYMEGYRTMPYKDTGGVWTVCRGITGEKVVPGRRYTDEECKYLEVTKYQEIDAYAKRNFRYWSEYNVWVKASFLDMLFNLGEGQIGSSTLLRLANEGALTDACMQFPRWIYGRNSEGKKVVLSHLEMRREATKEICLSWGREGHFSSEAI